MTSELLLLSTSTFLSEDLACITAGALVASGHLTFTGATAACFAGITAGDLGIFYAGRLLGTYLEPWLSSDRLQRASVWLAGNTAKAVLTSRFVPGTRTYTYFAAGVLRAPAGRFCAWFVVAGALWTPILVGSSALLGAQFTSSLLSAGGVGFILVFLYAVRTIPQLLQYEKRRLLYGWLLRTVRWEFWPVWATYLPLIPFLVCLAVKHRGLTVFTAANPAIPTGGLLEESKVQILEALDASGAVAPWVAVLPGSSFEVQREYPVVCKPEKGERGNGVLIAHTPDKVLSYLAEATGTTIVQDYIDGPEFGIFYYRFPNQPRGHILSITAKHLPSLTGDGVRTLKELILADDRAVAISDVYLKRHPNAHTFVPRYGESVRLIDVGSHCRGAVFLDGNHLNSAALEERVDEIARGYCGFYFGRFDVRASSCEALSRGEFRILELNGVAAEATHIYDPKVSLFEAYRVMRRQWSLAFAIGAMNRRRGCRPATVTNLLRLLLKRIFK